MKNVLLYYNFSYPLGGGDILPLTFASWLQSRCDLTLAVDSEAGFRGENPMPSGLDRAIVAGRTAWCADRPEHVERFGRFIPVS